MNADLSRIMGAVWPHMAWRRMVWPHVHDISMAALAAAVVMLGIVILLELRSVLRLRQVVDGNLARVFEQLDLLRFENQQLIEGQQLIGAQAQAGVASAAWRAAPVQSKAVQSAAVQPAPAQSAPAPVTTPPAAGPGAAAMPATAGEARLLSSLAQARARRETSAPLRA